MKKLLIFFVFCSFASYGQFTKPELYQGINANIRLKSPTSARIASMMDSIVVSMGSGGGSSLTLVNGNGTTVNGTGDGVDLGGTLTGDVEIDGDNTYSLSSYNLSSFQLQSINDSEITSGGNLTFDVTNDILLAQKPPTATLGDILTRDTSTGALEKLGIGSGLSISSGNLVASGGITISTTPITGGASGRLLTSGTTVGELALGTGISTWLGAPSWTNFNSAITGTAPFIKTTGTSSLTGNILVAGSGSNYNFVFGSTGSGEIGSFEILANQIKIDYSSTNATGDTYYRNSSGYFTRLAAGTNGHVLTLAGGIPSWAAPSGLTVGTSTITSGTNTKVLYNNSGVLGEYTVSGTGNVALTTSPTFTTPDIGTATGTASGDWHLTGTSTLTGAVNVVGSATNKFKFTIPSLGTSVTDEFLIENNTAATSGNQQSSGLVLGGYGWKTTSTAASQSVKFQLLNTPVQGTTNPSGIFSIKASINGAAYGSDVFSVTSSGDGALSSLTLSSNRYISFSGGVGSIYSSGNAGLSLRASDGTTIISGGAVRMWNVQNFSATSGNQIHLGVEIPFAPTSGTATMTALNISGAINQTGGANGAIRGLYYNPTLTALGGTNRVIDATSGDINLDAGNAYIKGTGTGTGKGLTISDSGSNERFSVQHNGVINVNGSGGTAGQVLVSNGTSAATWTAPIIKTSTTKTVTETRAVNMGTIGASSTASSAIRVNADYGNSTTLIADITVYAIKSDGSASVMGKVTGRYRKNSSGTFSVDDAGTTVTSDVTILLSIVPEINGTNPQVQVNTGASAANYDFSFTAVCSYITY